MRVSFSLCFYGSYLACQCFVSFFGVSDIATCSTGLLCVGDMSAFRRGGLSAVWRFRYVFREDSLSCGTFNDGVVCVLDAFKFVRVGGVLVGRFRLFYAIFCGARFFLLFLRLFGGLFDGSKGAGF